MSVAATRATARRDRVLLTAAILVAWLGVALFRASMSGDGFFTLAAGRLVLETGALPGRDPFAYGSVPDRWILHFPLVQLGYALLHRWGGLFAVTVVSALAAAAAFTALSRSVGGRVLGCVVASVPLLWLAVVDGAAFETRAQAFATGLLVIAFLLVERLRRGRAVNPLAFAALGCLWVNTHPSFVTAIGWPLLVLVATRFDDDPPAWRPFLIASVATAAGALVSPYGPQLFLDDVRMMGMDSTTHINHFLPPDLRDPLTLAGVIALGALIALRGRFGARSLATSDAILLTCLLAASITSRRFLLLAVCFAVLAAGPFWRRLVRHARLPRTAAVALAGLVAVGGVALGASPRDPFADVPVAAAQCIDERDLGTQVLTLWAWGGYLDWRFQGRRKPLVDGRTQLFADSLAADYRHMIHAGPAALSLLDLYEVEVVLVKRTTPLAALLQQTPAWQQTCDVPGEPVVFQRTPSPDGPDEPRRAHEAR